MKKKSVLLLGGIIAIIIVGLAIKILVGKNEKNSSHEKKSLPPLNKLSSQELEKCLLEDFSRRLELEKYFVFNLGELKKGKVSVAGLSAKNIRANNSILTEHLTKLAKKFDKNNQLEKKFIRLLDSSGDNVIPEYTGEKLDEKIENGKDTYIVFDKNNDVDYKGAMPRFGFNETDAVGIKIKEQNIFKNKTKVLTFLKNNDSALSEKN